MSDPVIPQFQSDPGLFPDDAPTDAETIAVPYRVLARKYRPQTFADLIGQDPMVRTLRNAFATDRIAHAFILTGVRGVGKTTTARIIAKGLNCIGPDGRGGPTTEPCGVCEPCRAITDGRHVDVLEMDAASRTGVADIREIIDSVHYRATSARMKIYIIDEVHMLSTNAFNALLKTLEEPPAHVKFLFATTEIRKVPVTVLSRCQRFDLRRIEPQVMIAHLAQIAALENADVATDALALIARAAEGSVRDAMSLLDQAIAHGAGRTTADQVRAMLGLADRGRVLDLFDMVLKGDAAAALAEFAAQYADGADPLAVLRDLAEIAHWISVVKITPGAAEDPTVGPDERTRGLAMAQALPMRVLTRLWQMLLKALEEVAVAPNAVMAADMAIIRLTYVADLPTPDELIRRLQSASLPATPPPATPPPAAQRAGAGASGSAAVPTASGPAQPAPAITARLLSSRTTAPVGQAPAGGNTALARQPDLAADPEPPVVPAALADFPQVLDLIRSKRDMKLLLEVETHLRLARYSPGRIEFEPTQDAPRDLAARLGQRLQTWTAQRWAVTLVNEGGAATVTEARQVSKTVREAKAMQHPLVMAAISAFPGAVISEIRTVAEPEPSTFDSGAEAEPAWDAQWDPFEDD